MARFRQTGRAIDTAYGNHCPPTPHGGQADELRETARVNRRIRRVAEETGSKLCDCTPSCCSDHRTVDHRQASGYRGAARQGWS